MTDADRALTRHFVRHFLDVGFMTSEGSDGVRRALLGVMSAVITIGLFLPRVMLGKYAGIRGIPDVYHAMVIGDTLMTFSFAMLLAAFAAAFAGDSMFPDETDFRVLTPLPVTRGFVFSAKLRAIAFYLGLAVVVAALALQLPLTAITGGPHAERTWLARAAMYSVASMVASLFAAAAVMAIQGLIVLVAPGRHLRAIAVGARTAMLCGVVLLLPLAGRLPRAAAGFSTETPLLFLAPPAWFVGLQRVALGAGSAFDAQLAGVGVAALVLAAAVVTGCYVVLYRRFDVLMLRQDLSSSAGRNPRKDDPLKREAFAPTLQGSAYGAARVAPDAARDAADQTRVVARFAARTLWRSPLQQVVFLGVTACGVGWSLNGLLSGGLITWLRDGGVPSPRLIGSVTSMPFVLLLMGATGLRAALMLPQDPQANWIFRMREDDERRPAQLDAVERLFMRLVVWPVLLCMLPLQLMVLGVDAVATIPVTYLAGVVLIELLIRTWRRIPFTCGYIPGKRNVALTFLIALTVYIFYTNIGAGMAAAGRFHPSRLMIVVGMLLTAAGVLRRHRLRSWGQSPLMFDDDPAEFVQPLQLL
jgi:hypothetical protein